MIIKTKEMTMRYALRNKDKIAAAYSPEYLKEHIIESLNRFFRAQKSQEDFEVYVAMIGAEYCTNQQCYDVLQINDVADDRCMLQFALLSTQYDVVRLAFLGRAKG